MRSRATRPCRSGPVVARGRVSHGSCSLTPLLVSIATACGTDGNGATIFHRVIPGFVVQGGGLTEDLQTKNTLPPIDNESGNGLANVRGAISMARTKDPSSATCQFFINLVDNDFLDDPPGYAVFGAVVEGMEGVDAMAAVQTTTMGQLEDVPVEPIVVIAAQRL